MKPRAQGQTPDCLWSGNIILRLLAEAGSSFNYYDSYFPDEKQASWKGKAQVPTALGQQMMDLGLDGLNNIR